ncbi:SRPBCC domain-containing protein [Isoptericola hypogeus]|uniref:SRPBCC domain-containing protein n=1 Tax=Isoptericola hypogeus TaxID=300179 RepID=A0ABP4VTK1_9MICO
MSTTDHDLATEQVYQIVIRTTPERLWEAITSPAFTTQYFHGARIDVTPERYTSRGPDGQSWGDDAVYEFDPPHRLVHGWRSLYDPDLADEPESRVTWQIEPRDGGLCLLTVTHDRLEGSPRTARGVSGEGWTTVLSGLKTLLETGSPMLPADG